MTFSLLCDKLIILGGDFTVIICDCHYRSAITAIRSFSALGKKIVAVTTDKYNNPPSFSSTFVNERYTLPSDKEEYKIALLKLCASFDKPILFPVGKFSLEIISENSSEFFKLAHFCVPSTAMLDNLNNKKWVKEQALRFNVKVPHLYQLEAVDKFPVVVKPYCGEAFSLKASERYRIVHNREELTEAYQNFKKYDDSPMIEEFVQGQGVGVSVMFDNDSNPLTVFCHKRLIEYPIDGGPSAYLTTFYDKDLIDSTVNFFKSIDFKGFAMAEYKETENGYVLLEVNPRIWGSFPATLNAKSNFIEAYLNACECNGEYLPEYNHSCKVKFLRGLIMATLSFIKRREIKKGFKSLCVLLNPFIHDATFSIKDPITSIKDFFRR